MAMPSQFSKDADRMNRTCGYIEKARMVSLLLSNTLDDTGDGLAKHYLIKRITRLDTPLTQWYYRARVSPRAVSCFTQRPTDGNDLRSPFFGALMALERLLSPLD